MIGGFRPLRARPGSRTAAELARLHERVARMRREVADLHEQANAIYGQAEATPPPLWRGPNTLGARGAPR